MAQEQKTDTCLEVVIGTSHFPLAPPQSLGNCEGRNQGASTRDLRAGSVAPRVGDRQGRSLIPGKTSSSPLPTHTLTKQ